jgi:hypothetical protein
VRHDRPIRGVRIVDTFQVLPFEDERAAVTAIPALETVYAL